MYLCIEESMKYSSRCNALLLVMLTMGMVGMEQEKESVSSYKQFMENIAIGSVAGGTEVMAEGQLLTSAKNILQRIEGKSLHEKFTRFVTIIKDDPKILYRGFGINMACMIPTTAAQIATDKKLEELLPAKDLTTSIGRAYIAGSLSAGFISPTEMMALHQQLGKKNAYQTFKQLTADKGMIKKVVTMYRGLGPKMHRDGPFGAALLAGYPWMKKNCQNYTDDDLLTTIGAGMTVGGGIAFATHPFDRVSTFMQMDYKKQQAKTMWDAFRVIYKQKGFGDFYAGVLPRALRAAFAIPIIYTTQEKLRDRIHNKTT